MKLQGRALQQLAGAYAVGSLSPRTRRRFEALLERDLSARRAWQQWEERLSDLVPPLPPVRPSEHTWQRIESRVGTKPQPRRNTSRSWVLLAALLLGVAAVLILARI
jgi:anti-sigma-K factor RskA